MDDRIRRALSRGHLIDLTTTGRKTGQPRRIELVFHAIDGRVYISGMPGFPRSWLANIKANPAVTFHLKGAVQADLAAPPTKSLNRRSGAGSWSGSPPTGAAPTSTG